MERTTLLFEHTYLDEGIRVEDVLAVVVEALAPWVRAYEARLIAPRRNVTPAERQGHLPAATDERRAALREFLSWLQAGTDVPGLFLIRLMDKEGEECPCFEYPDTAYDWNLWLTADQHAALQEALAAASLPADLFFEAERLRCIPWPGTRWRDRLLRRLGVQRCLTPRQQARLLAHKEVE